MADIYNERAGAEGLRLLDSFVVYMGVLGTSHALAQERPALDAYFAQFRNAWLEARQIAPGEPYPDAVVGELR